MSEQIKGKSSRFWTRYYKKQNKINYRFAEGKRVKKIAIRVGALALVLALVCGLLWFIQFSELKRQERPELDNLGLAASLGAIELEAGEVVVADDEQASLVLNTTNLNLRLENKGNGQVWYLQNPDENASAAVKSLMNIEFLGENGELTEWNTYSYSVAGQNYSIDQIENGIRITLNISQGASIRFDDYMPRKISIERYEAMFEEALEAAKDSDEIDGNQFTMMKLALQTAYRKNTDEDIYYLNYIGNPPSSTVRRLIDVAKAVGYSYEDLIADNEAHGIVMEERENPEFSIPFELSLDNGDLIARVPAAAVVNKNAYYQLQSVAVLPNLALADAASYKEGSMLVPDGSGALITFNQASSNYPAYARQFRDSNYYDEYYFASNYSEKMSMPIFGMIYGAEGGSEKAILGIVEEGSVLGGVRAVQANTGSELQELGLNRIYTEFDMTQFARINVYGAYSLEDARYLVSTGMQDMSYQVRYKTFDAGADYYDLAKTYQDYLRVNGVGEAVDASYKELNAYLEFLGTIEIDKRFVGIPYESKYSMTSYEELAAILADLDQDGLLLNYKGAFSGGYDQDILNSTKLEKTNGSTKEWNALKAAVDQYNAKLSLEGNLSRVSGKQFGFVPGTHGIKAFDTYTAYIYEYWPYDGSFNEFSYNYVRLSPWYLSSIVDGFLADDQPTELLTVADLATDFFADYNKQRALSAVESEQIIKAALADLDGAYDLVLQDGFMSYAEHASFISDVSRKSSRYASFYEDIPFRQIVLNGLIPYSTETINMSADQTEYFLLQVAETAAIPQFTLTAESPEIMKELSYGGFYSTQYSAYRDLIDQVLTESEAIRQAIGSDVLSDHRQLDSKVFVSTYENGTQVLTNYNEFAVEHEGHELPALGYLILTGSEASLSR